MPFKSVFYMPIIFVFFLYLSVIEVSAPSLLLFLI